MVTWHGLITGAVLLAGAICAGFGALEAFAGGMSAAPAAGRDMTKRGCAMTLAGLAVIALAIALMVRA